jgi:hypothetical protein
VSGSDGGPPGTVEQFATELGLALEPLASAVDDGSEGIKTFLTESGIDEAVPDSDLTSLVDTLENGFDPVVEVLLALVDEDEPAPDPGDVLDAIDAGYGTLAELDSLEIQGVDAAGEQLLDYLLVTYLDRHRRAIYSICSIIGVVTESDGRQSLDFSALSDALSDPTSVPKELLNWGETGEDLLAMVVLYYLKELCWSLDVSASLSPTSPEQVSSLAGITNLDGVDESAYEMELKVPVMVLSGDEGRFVTGIKLVPVPGDTDHLPGLAVVTFGNFSAGQSWDLDAGWTFNVSSSGELGEYGFTFRPTTDDGVDLETVSFDDSSVPSELRAGAELGFGASADPESGDERVLLGTPDATRLSVTSVAARAELTVTSDGDFEVTVALPLGGVVAADPASFDGFLEKVMPEDGLEHEFEITVGWSSESGLFFDGGGTLSASIPQNVDIGPVTMEEVYLALTPDAEHGDLAFEAAASAGVELGPMDLTVQRMGLSANAAFPDGADGNLGPLDLQVSFKPPAGAGGSVDAGVVTGGGYLEFDHENERYAGVLQLHIGELTLTAVGLLTTQLPGGRDGFSLLLIISGEFPAFQLGFGFTLEGVGGLLGVNRTMDVDYLVAGVSDGTVRSIMFPDDPVRNAPQIISDLRNGFPVSADNHVFGPMGKLGWGTPTMMSASVGVIMALPDPIRIAILGRVHVGLPHEEAGLVVLNMDVLGAVDFGERTAQAAASLYDSRILAYTLTGDMAMKTGWGDDPDFALSVGGFNQRFDPPAEFPELRRIALTLGPGNPRVRWEGYFAVTSNTVQVGAGVEVYAEAADFSFEGEMGFDTLFRFEPFELIADFYAGFGLYRGGSQLMGVDLDGTLKGPGPWHVTGKASFEIWPISFDVSIDQQFGQEESADELSPADVFGQVVAALGDQRNWSAQRPANGVSAVTLRQVEAEGGQVLAHPLGRLAVRQQISPLGVSIETYGNGAPATYDHFEIGQIEWGDLSDEADPVDNWDESDPMETREKFARGEYFELSDDEKLEGPPFESYAAGCELAAPGFDFGGNDDDESLMTAGTLAYETAVIDEKSTIGPVAIGRIAMPQSIAEELAAVSAVARGPLRTTGEARYEVDDEDTGPTGVEGNVSVSDVKFVVARTKDMSRAGLDAIPEAGTTWQEAREALEAYLAETGGDRDDYQIVGVHEVADGEDDQ